MRILANRQIKQLFLRIFVCIVGFLLVSVAAVSEQWEYAVSIILLAAIFLGMLIFFALYLYFRKQEQIMEEAIAQIQEYISGNRDARIDCNEEGELYRLFHEVNSLAAILDAHAANEGDAKAFLRICLKLRNLLFFVNRSLIVLKH